MCRVEIAESLALKDSATEAFKAQDYDKAVEDLTAAISLDPSNQVFYSNRSVAYTAMQMYEKVRMPSLAPFGWSVARGVECIF